MALERAGKEVINTSKAVVAIVDVASLEKRWPLPGRD